ncbi:ABC transporter ATP-binding protein [Sedimentibacter sp. zth1]|uniref:ABC transporter ATP-binding protein n=1 Tax=Sedimentibacter sp. zth1 TaxID=2816908 RepID=UPI001F5E540E
MEIYAGDFTTIMGPSGSGKSTLLYCISGMDKLTEGEVLYNNECISKYSEKKMALLRRGDFGFVFQQIHLVSNLTLFENVAVPGYLNSSKTNLQINKRAEKLLTSVNLKDRMKHLPSQVSGGEQQRAAVARALINEPKLLFADKPTGALNRKNTEEVLELFSKINDAGQSILMVTHDVRIASRATEIIKLQVIIKVLIKQECSFQCYCRECIG